MKVKIMLFLIIIMQQSCIGKNQTKTLDQQVMEIKQNLPTYDKKPYYTMQIGGGNCNFDIRVNDMPVWSHLRERGGISTNVPLNVFILESGLQNVSIKIFPRKNEKKLTKYANLNIEIRLYKDVNDPVSEYESVLKYELEVPEEGIPLAEYNNKFNATVPYKIEAWQNSQDLTKVKDIEAKVLAFYKKYWKLWKNKDVNAIVELQKNRERRVAESLYLTDEQIKDRIKNVREIMLNKDAVLQPIDKYIMVYYANNKVVTLLLPNGDDLFHIIIKSEDGDETISNTIRLHLPKRSNKLEMI